jgi:hypothetical protein
MKQLATGLLVLIASFHVYGAEGPAPEQIAAAFFDTLLKGDTSKAVDQFFLSNSAIKQRVEQIKLLKSQLSTVTDIYGKPFAVESVFVEDLTPITAAQGVHHQTRVSPDHLGNVFL